MQTFSPRDGQVHNCRGSTPNRKIDVEDDPSDFPTFSSLGIDQLKKLYEEAENEPLISPAYAQNLKEEAIEEQAWLYIEFAPRLLKDVVSPKSKAACQACRLLQYYLFADDTGMIDAEPVPKGQRLRPFTTHLKALRKFVAKHPAESRGSLPSYTTDSEALMTSHFRGLEIQQLGLLCKYAGEFAWSVAMKHFLLNRDAPGVTSSEIAQFLTFRHGPGYIGSHSTFADPNDVAAVPGLRRMEYEHMRFIEECRRRLKMLEQSLTIHPAAYLVFLNNFTKFAGEAGTETKNLIKSRFGLDTAIDAFHITPYDDCVIRAYFLQSKYGKRSRFTLKRLGEIIKPDSADPATTAYTALNDLKKTPWLISVLSAQPGETQFLDVPTGRQMRYFVESVREINTMVQLKSKRAGA